MIVYYGVRASHHQRRLYRCKPVALVLECLPIYHCINLEWDVDDGRGGRSSHDKFQLALR